MTGCVAALYGEAVEDEERLALLDKVFEMGCTFWDTAGEFFFFFFFWPFQFPLALERENRFIADGQPRGLRG